MKTLIPLGNILVLLLCLASRSGAAADEPYPSQIFNYPALTEDARPLLDKNISPKKDRSIKLSTSEKQIKQTPMQLTKVTTTGPNGPQESYRRDPITDLTLKDAAVSAVDRLFRGETVPEAYVTDKELVVKGKLIELDFWYVDQSNPNARILIKAEEQVPLKEAFIAAVRKNYAEARIEDLSVYKETRVYFGFLLDGKAMPEEHAKLEDSIGTLLSQIFSGIPPTDGQYKAKGEKGEEIEVTRNKEGSLTVSVDGTAQVASFQFFYVSEVKINGEVKKKSVRFTSHDDYYLNVLNRRHTKAMFESAAPKVTPATPSEPPLKFEDFKGPKIVEIPVAKLEAAVLIPGDQYVQKFPTFLEQKLRIGETEPKFDRVINKALAKAKVLEIPRESLLSAAGKVDKDSSITALIHYDAQTNVISIAKKSFFAERFSEGYRSTALWFAIVQGIPEVSDGRAFNFAFSLQSYFRTNKQMTAAKLDSFLGELLATKEGLRLIALVEFLEQAEQEILKQAEAAPADLKRELRTRAQGLAEPARQAKDDALTKRIREVLNSAE